MMKRILIADDDPSMVRILKEIVDEYFGNDPYYVTEAEDGRDGFEKFLDDDFDMVITDLQMPKMNGLELLEKISHIISGEILSEFFCALFSSPNTNLLSILSNLSSNELQPSRIILK